MDDKDWLLLTTLKRCHSLSSAAEKLYVSQPALSKRIRGLEEEFQTCLLLRTRNGVQFTQAGELLCKYADSMLKQLQEVRDSLLEMREDRKILRVGSAPMFSQLVLPEVLKSFTARHPDIYLNIRTGISIIEFNWLKQGEIQLAFIRGNYLLEGYERYQISSDPLCLVSKLPINLNNLPNYPRIIYDTDPSLMETIDAWASKQFPQQKIHIGMRVGDSQTCIHIVSQGTGYALLPYYVLTDNAVQSLHVDFLKDFDDNVITRPTYLMFKREEYRQIESVQLFVDFVQQYFPTENRDSHRV